MDRRIAFHSYHRQSSLPFQASDPAWIPVEHAALAMDDWGLVQGATLVERLRTIHGQPLDVQPHLERLRHGANVLGIRWPEYLDAHLVHECCARNQEAHLDRDFSVVILLTPGRQSASLKQSGSASQPTLIMHSVDLNWKSMALWYIQGQPLIIADNRNVPAECWSPSLKTRSRLHYYLADRQAARSHQSAAGAAMLSIDGHLTESSIANILVIQDDALISPPVETVLHGISLERTLRLARAEGIEVRFEKISLDLARHAVGLLLTGSSGCLWPAASLDDVEYPDTVHHPIHQRLRSAWIADIGCDFVQQAVGFAG